MFTGLVEATGRVTALTAMPGGYHLGVRSGLGRELTVGDSLAVDGVCLTLVEHDGDSLAFDVGPETARVTTLGSLVPGQLVNLERPLRADGRLGGHFVLGHVDAVGRIASVRIEDEFYWFTISVPPRLAPLLIPKGSVAVNGISLTVAALGDDTFDVQIIPFTWTHTNLREARVGDGVNLEGDVIGKYVLRAGTLGAGVRPADAGVSG